MGVVVAVPKESAPGERRVALVPEVVQKLCQAGHTVRLEAGAGAAAYYPDELYAKAGATLVTTPADLLAGAPILLKVNPPTPDEAASYPAGAVLVSFLYPARNLESVRRLRDGKVTSFALELVPRITRAQSMDALSSQATAAGTIRPATVLILGAGVAGLMAIATARRLGALVEAYDVRRAAGEQVRSLGAKFLELEINAEGAGGYARELTAEEKVKEQEMVSAAVARADVVVTTANVPGRRAPRLITKETVARMRPGAVIVDLAAESGGNCELTRPGETVRSAGVLVLGPPNLPAMVPFHASQMFSKNLQAFLGLLIDPKGALVTSFSDEILAASQVTGAGEVQHAPTREALAGGPKP